MEPLSTIALLATLTTATVIPNFNSEKPKKHRSIVTSISLYNEVTVMESTVADLMRQHDKKIFVTNITNDALAQLNGYSELEPGWDGPDSVTPSSSDIDLATDFIASIPAVFPLPKAMLSSDGTLGLYWNDTLMYVDIQFESDRTLSVFLRDRSSEKERFIDSIDVTTINPSWFFNTLGELLSPAEDALAA